MKNLKWCFVFFILLQSCEKDPISDNLADKEIVVQDILTEGLWTRLADFGGPVRNHAAGFSIGIKGYIGTGFLGSPVNDFWEYDVLSDSWSQKANFGGGKRTTAVGFTIGEKGYIFGGISERGLEFPFNDLWEYDPDLNTWTKKASLPAKARYNAVAFSIADNGYVGTGLVLDSVELKDCIVTSTRAANDFWKYNQSANSWTRIADYAGGGRFEAVGFSIGNKGYLGTGQDNMGVFTRDFWEYSANLDSWARKADFGGQERSEAVGFGISSITRGYIGFGFGFTSPNSTSFGDFWEYNPAADQWLERAKPGEVAFREGVAFGIGSKGYVGTGFNSKTGNATKEFWEFDPLK